MDSSAIYVNARNDHALGDHRSIVEEERRAYMTTLMRDMMMWKWCDPVTGETLAPALDEPPELPELSRCMLPGSKIASEDQDPDELGFVEPAEALDCVLVYQYA
jgi:hypothetical protein